MRKIHRRNRLNQLERKLLLCLVINLALMKTERNDQREVQTRLPAQRENRQSRTYQTYLAYIGSGGNVKKSEEDEDEIEESPYRGENSDESIHNRQGLNGK